MSNGFHRRAIASFTKSLQRTGIVCQLCLPANLLEGQAWWRVGRRSPELGQGACGAVGSTGVPGGPGSVPPSAHPTGRFRHDTGSSLMPANTQVPEHWGTSTWGSLRRGPTGRRSGLPWGERHTIRCRHSGGNTCLGTVTLLCWMPPGATGDWGPAGARALPSWGLRTLLRRGHHKQRRRTLARRWSGSTGALTLVTL